MKFQSIELNNGHTMPTVGLGTWKLWNDDAKDAVRVALETGYRLIDTAALYENEQAIGEVVADVIRGGALTRDDLFITTKLWCTRFAKAEVKPAFEESLAKLGLDYVDLYLIHSPFGFKTSPDGVWYPVDASGKIEPEQYDLLETWKEMEDLVRAGKVRSLGVSNFNTRLLTTLCQGATILPVTNQVECNVYLQQRPLQDFCSKHGIVLTAYAPFASPGQFVTSLDETTTRPLNDPVVIATADKYKRTPAQILIRYLLQRKMVALPKSVTPDRIKENLQVSDFDLSKEDMEKLHGLDRNRRIWEMTTMLHCHPEYPREDLF